MFSFKRIGDSFSNSLGQVQEQARQQLAKSQKPVDSPKGEEITPQDENVLTPAIGEEPEIAPSEDKGAIENGNEEGKKSSSAAEAAKNESLPKDVRIKLVKLAKYEDRHPKLQAAYKESQSRITAFERILKERTPLGSIDEIESFENYLNNLTQRSDMSIEELKRIMKDKEVLKKEMDEIKKVHHLQTLSYSEEIQNLQTKINDLDDPHREADMNLPTNKAEQAPLRVESTHIDELEELLRIALLEKETAQKAQQEVEQSMQTEAANLRNKVQSISQRAHKADEVIALLEEKLTNAESKWEMLSVVSGNSEKFLSATSSMEAPSIPTPSMTSTTTSSKKKKKKKKVKDEVHALSHVPNVSNSISPMPLDVERLLRSPNLLKEQFTSTAWETQVLGLTSADRKLQREANEMARRLFMEDLKVVTDECTVLGERIKVLEKEGEDVDGLRDMIRNIGNELVETKEANRDLKSLNKKFVEKLKFLETQTVAKLSSVDEAVSYVLNGFANTSNRIISAYSSRIDSARQAQRHLEEEVGKTQIRLTAEIERLTTETISKKSFNDLELKLTVAQKSVESRSTELAQVKEQLARTKKELHSLTLELGEISQREGDLGRKLGDSEAKVRQLEVEEKKAKESSTAAQISLDARIKELERVDAEMREIRSLRDNAEKTLRQVQQVVRRTEADLIDTRNRELLSREEANRWKHDAEASLDRISSLETVKMAITLERDSLLQELQIKTAELVSAQSLMESHREETVELAHRTREARDRCDALEEELSEARQLMLERAREAETMRRLLAESEVQERDGIKEAKETIDTAIEERDKVEQEIITLTQNAAAGTQELRDSLRLKDNELDELRKIHAECQGKIGKLTEEIEKVGKELAKARENSDNANQKLVQSMSSLASAQQQVRELDLDRRNVKEAAEESQLRVEQLQKIQRHLTDELKKLRSMQSIAAPSTTSPSHRDAQSPGNLSVATSPRSSSNGGPDSVDGVDKEYLKNVLLQFFEYKERRAQLIPVLSTLLNFSSADELKLLR